MIPKTPINLKNSRWNLNITGSRNRTGVTNVSNVPTAAFRTGDFSAISATNVIYDPTTGAPFTGNIIPTSRLSPTALALLKYYPLPTSVGITNNFEYDASNPSNSNNVNFQLSDPLTARDRINVNLSYQSRNSANIQTFGFKDPTTGSGGNLSLSYARTLQPTMVNTLTLAANRNSTNNLSYFSYGENVAADLGIAGVFSTPATYGPPVLGFNNFGNLNDATPSTNHSVTFTLTDAITKVKGKHNFGFGWTGSKRESNSLVANNARGEFTFTGASTQLAGTTNTGYDLADFLLGLPAQSTVNNYVNNMFYYRQKTMGAYAQDDWRASNKLTINAGLRWEYYGPQTEKNGHMANVDFNSAYTAAAVVTPGQTGPYSSEVYPDGLIHADFKLFEPQVGIAAKPWAKRPLVIRAGYGIRYNGGAIAAFGSKLAIEYPFVSTVSVNRAQDANMTINNGFLGGSSLTVPNTYAVSPNYRPAMAQQWNTIMQYTIGRSWVAQLSYNGIKGTHLDVLQAPNRATPGPSDPTSEAARLPIKYATTNLVLDESIGNSIMNSGSAQITRRLGRGLAGSASYTFAKSIDDSSTLGGAVVQIENNILAERAVTSSVPRHTMAINLNYQTLSGNQKTQFYYTLLRGWQLLNTYNLTSGTPFTAYVSGDPSGTGVIGSTRADATGLSVTASDPGYYFNRAAFGPVPEGTYGTAGRNTIPGIWNFTLRSSATRSFRIGERHRLQLTFTATNPLNHVSINRIGTTFGISTYGIATGAGPMRTVTAQARFTF